MQALSLHGLHDCLAVNVNAEAARKKHTEREFVRKRRAGVAKGMLKTKHVPVSETQLTHMCVDGFQNQALMKEASFLADKQSLRRVEAINLGSLGGSDVTAQDAEIAQATAKHQRGLDAKRIAAEKRVASRTQRAPDISLHGVSCFVDLQSPLSDALLRVFKFFSIQVETQRAQCSIILTDDPGNTYRCNVWAALFCGLRLATPTYILTGSMQGASIQYKSVLDTKRYVWISDEFVDANPDETDIIVRAIATRGKSSKWVMISTGYEFLERSVKFSAPKGGGKYRAIALVTDAQKREYNVLNAFTVDEFIKFAAFGRIDQLRSTRM